MDVNEKKVSTKTLAQDVFDRRWSLDGGKDTYQNISARSLTVLCGGVGIVWSTTTQTRVSDATAVTFSVKCFKPIKTLFCHESSSESGLLHT